VSSIQPIRPWQLPQATAGAQSGASAAQGQEHFVYITGDVSKPGKYPLTGSMTVVQLVALSGGLQHARDILTGKDLAKNNVNLRSGDVVIVRSSVQRR